MDLESLARVVAAFIGCLLFVAIVALGQFWIRRAPAPADVPVEPRHAA